MGKYLLIILVIMVMGMILSIVPALLYQQSPNLLMFYGHLGGALIVVGYSTYANRKKTQSERRRR